MCKLQFALHKKDINIQVEFGRVEIYVFENLKLDRKHMRAVALDQNYTFAMPLKIVKQTLIENTYKTDHFWPSKLKQA